MYSERHERDGVMTCQGTLLLSRGSEETGLIWQMRATSICDAP